MGKLDQLIERKGSRAFVHRGPDALAVFAPDLGARVFCELRGALLHRLDMDNVLQPNRPFNNYGGNNFWPAPEGGKFGFNYEGDTWRVQPAINDEPFRMENKAADAATASKRVVLRNRAGVALECVMRRRFAVADLHPALAGLGPVAAFAYTVEDSIELLGDVRIDQALAACWTLEQFDAGDATITFVRVDRPKEAINFDFYEHPGDRITYGPCGFRYRTDGRKRGQIGVRKDSAPQYIGFSDTARRLICIRDIIGPPRGLYFNIADNEQPAGPFSAADTYSIFNGDETMGFFELETVGGADVEGDRLRGSRLLSRTSFAVFDPARPAAEFIQMTGNLA